MKNKTKKQFNNGFPYIYKTMPPPKIMMQQLKTTKINTYKYKNKTVISRSYINDYNKSDGLSNHFTEPIRMKCKIGKNPSPLQSWRKNKNKITKKCGGPKNIICMNTQLFYLKMCNTFNPTIMMFFIKLAAKSFNIKQTQLNILDPSSGWGDRLIGAIACNVNIYHGYDPNKALQPCYKNIINTFCPNISDSKYIVKTQKFETSNIQLESYHLVLTSPPFFSLEMYSDGGSNHVTENKDYNKWLSNFYTQYIVKAWNAVAINGYLVLYVENIGIYRFANDTYNIVTDHIARYNYKCKFMKYGFTYNKRDIRKILVWQKLGKK